MAGGRHEPMLLFVYGSLMRGEANHDLLAGAEYLGTACTEPRFTLFDLGSFPAMARGGETAVQGELYRVNEERLQALDLFEEHPHFYRRCTIRLEDGRRAFAYLIEEHEQLAAYRRLASGDWRRRPPAYRRVRSEFKGAKRAMRGEPGSRSSAESPSP